MLSDEELNSKLLERGLKNYKGVILGNGTVHFLLYSLTGKITGYQRYKPDGLKSSRSNRLGSAAKYYTYITKGEMGFWGSESYDPKAPLFFTEGVFNAVKIHNSGYPCLAILCSTPSKEMAGFFNTLPNPKIILRDNDGHAVNTFSRMQGLKLYPPPQYGDIGDMPQGEVDIFTNQLIKQHVK